MLTRYLCTIWRFNGDIKIVNCELKSKSAAANAQTIGITIYAGGKTEVLDTNITMAGSTVGLEAKGIINAGQLTMVDSYVYTDAPSGSAGEKNSIGVYNRGVAYLTNTYVYGTHSGIQTNAGSKTYVNGGTIEGPGHGGFYFAHGSTGEAYIEGAKIVRCPYRGEYEDFNLGGDGGFYVGASNDEGNYMVVNLNNCEITNPSGPAIVLSSSYGGAYNTVRISNCFVSTNSKIRIDSDTHKLYIGKNCNVGPDDASLPSTVIETEEVYIRQ